MILPIALVVVAAVLISSGFTRRSIAEVINGDPEPPSDSDPSNFGSVGRGADTTTSPAGDSPKAIIDNEVIPLAQAHGIHITPQSVAAANATHGPTITGSVSDHQGPPSTRWAADMSNGNSPTPQMDALARDLANRFGIHWTGSGLANSTHDGFRYQLIYRTLIGGNHFNHVHFGVKRV